MDDIALSGVIGALSYALDITEGQPAGHAVRSCMIGMRIAEELRLPAALETYAGADPLAPGVLTIAPATAPPARRSTLRR